MVRRAALIRAERRRAEEARGRRRRLRILGVVLVVVVLGGAWLLLASSNADDQSALASNLAEVGERYLDARNDVVTARGGDGMAPSVLMTTEFEAGLIDQVAELRRRPAGQYVDALTTVRLESHDIVGNDAAIVVIEHTRLRLGEGESATFSEYTLEHRLRFERVAGDWLLASDEILSCGLMPETVPGPSSIDCSTPTASP